MEALKAKAKAKRIEKNVLSRVLLFTGNGKGKTTAALGTAIRALGHEKKVAIFYFVKSKKEVGEVLAIEKLQKIFDKRIQQYMGGLGFVPPKKHISFLQHKKKAVSTLKKACLEINKNFYDIVILDEISWAIHKELIQEKKVIEIVENRPKDVSIILTGRAASTNLIAVADTVTNMEFIKHPYQSGSIIAAEGIEK